MNKFFKAKKRLLVMIFMLLLVIIGGTYAWYSYRSNEMAMVLTVGDLRKLKITLSPYQINTSFAPANTYEGNENVSVTAINNKDTEARFSLYYQIDNIDDALKSEYFKYTILRSTNGGDTYEEYLTGDFSNVENEDTLIILNKEVLPNNVTYLYQVYLWIDGSETDNTAMEGAIFKGELRANVSSTEQIIVDVMDGLIPVTIDDNGTVTTISSTDKNWYDYDSQKWANAVLVSESSRSNYSSSGVEVTKSDILGYYVYVPRFSYSFISADGEPESILIMFENVYEEKLTGSATGNNYLTHPAFTFGDNEINGLWVGKFETTGTADKPTVLPGVEPLNGQNISTQFTTSLKFAGGTLSDGTVSFSGTSTYGLTGATDSHMMKNSEWGAVAYLSHSVYGINDEIRLNNFGDNSSGSYLLRTGCGASSENAAVSTTCTNSYGSGISEYPQSTTGNVTGIFDMSGGGWDAVMAVSASSDGIPYSAGQVSGDTGFNGNDTNNGSYTSGIDFPTPEYYDLYKEVSNSYSITTACNGDICYGHALSETTGWYDDAVRFESFLPWIYRGSNFINEEKSGIFAYSVDAGYEGTSGLYSFRSVLLTIPNMSFPTVTLLSNVEISEGNSIATKISSIGETAITVPANTTYYLKAWGAGGGNASTSAYTGTSTDFPDYTYYGGNGAYARGKIPLSRGTNLYAYVGGLGGTGYVYYTNSSTVSGGTNGGGSAYMYYPSSSAYTFSGGGGGATHFATSSGKLSTLDDDGDTSDVIMVAGGGGGGAMTYFLSPASHYGNNGGDAGGIWGDDGAGSCYGYGGGQSSSTKNTCSTSKTSFGAGSGVLANSSSYYYGGGGGGGYYGGGGGMGSSGNPGGGGGGSSYIRSDMTDAYVICYNCNTYSKDSGYAFDTFSSSNYSTYNYIPDYTIYNNGGEAVFTTNVTMNDTSSIKDVYYAPYIYYKTIESGTGQPKFTLSNTYTSSYNGYQVTCDNNATVNVSENTITVIPVSGSTDEVTCKFYYAPVSFNKTDSELLVFYDGFNKTGEQNSVSTAVDWKNLAGSSYDGYLYGDYAEWTSSANQSSLYVAGYSYESGLMIEGSNGLLADSSKSFTVQAYIDPGNSDTDYWRTVIANSEYGGFELGYNSSEYVTFGVDTLVGSSTYSYSYATVDTAMSKSSGKYLVTGTYDANTKEICAYVKGPSVDDSACTTLSSVDLQPASNTLIALGCGPSGSTCGSSYGYYGYIHSVMIYESVLSKEEREYNYNFNAWRYGTS